MGTVNDIFGKSPDDKFFAVEQAILRIGQGGGKNYTVTGIVDYAIYLWCCLDDPHKYFGKPPHNTFDILNFSQVNQSQAKNVFFNELASVMRLTKDPTTGQNWFVSHMGMRIQEYGAKDIKEESMDIPHRIDGYGGIRVFVLDSQAGSVEGYTIWMAILDEPSRANTDIKYKKAKHQYNTAITNMKTRFAKNHRLMLAFSYPEQEVNDLLVELYLKFARTVKENFRSIYKGVLTAWYNTWTFNAFDVEGKKAEYEEDLKSDEIDALRRWRAIIPPNEFGFFNPHFEKIHECSNPNMEMPVKYKKTLTIRQEMKHGVLVDQSYTALELIDVIGDMRDRWWGGDFAVSGDALTLVGGYAKKMERPIASYNYRERTDKGIEVKKSKVIDVRPVIDIILEWRPRPGIPIDYQNVEDVILDFIRVHFPNSHSLHFDNFNTESIRTKAVDTGLRDCQTIAFSNTIQIKLGRLFRHLVWNNAIEYPDNATFQTEMSQLLLINNSKINHPEPHGSKDIYDAAIICTDLIMTHAAEVHGWEMATGEDVDVDEERNLIGREYADAIRTFEDNFGRPPTGGLELIEWFKVKYKKNYTESDILDMSEDFRDMMQDVNQRVLGLRQFQKDHIDTNNPIRPEDNDIYHDMLDEMPNDSTIVKPKPGMDDHNMGFNNIK